MGDAWADSAAISAALAALGVATVWEANGREGLLDLPLTQITPGSRAAGPARTVRCAQDDNLMVHAVMAQAQPGEILALTMPTPTPVALIGDLLATQARLRGVVAVLVDAAARDVAELQAMGLPVWARYIRARAAAKSTVGAINVPVTVGGATIHPGDYLTLDADGAVVVARERVARTLAAAQARAAHEEALRAQLEAGALTYDLHGLRALVEGSQSAKGVQSDE